MTSEVKKTLKEMKNNKSPCIDNLTSDIMIFGGEESMKQLTKIFNQILETKNIPAEWKEVKMIILHKKGDMRDIKLQAHQFTFPHVQIVHTDITKKNRKGSG